MLTREQALTKYCPHKFPMTAVAGIIAGLVPDLKELIADISCNCTANDCPKWVDDKEVGTRCPYGRITDFTCPYDKETVGIRNQHCIDDCPHRYGRCGG